YLDRRDGYHGFLRKKITPDVVKNAGGMTTVTANLREAMENHGLIARHTVTVPNVVDVDFFRPPPLKEHRDKTIFIHLSCFEERSKNMSGILKAAKLLSELRQDFLLYMVGEGIDWEKAVQEADRLKLKDKFVYFTGLKQGQDLLQLMQRADVMLLYSHYENLPVVILEAFSCGMPVISSDVGGIAEHLSAERGMLIPPGDSKLLSNTMAEMMMKLPEYDRNKIRNYAVNHFSMPVIGSQFDHLYQKVLQEQ
ncbi:MAG TPA: glycosyltransferase, partial [Bacteroidales bacterium]|nr:glycosyltransferase [Bacteroidales bacterium]